MENFGETQFATLPQYTNPSEQSQYGDDCTKIIPLSETTSQVTNIIEQKAFELDLLVELRDSDLLIWGSYASAEALSHFVEGFVIGRNSLAKTAQYHKEIKLSETIRSCLVELEKYASALMVNFAPNDNTALLSGNLENVTDFIHHMYTLSLGQDSSGKEQESSDSSSDIKKEEILISTFHRMKKDEIYKKAFSLDLFIEFGYDIIAAQGTKKSLKDFRLFLSHVETEGKKSLYPRFWNIYESKIYSEVFIEQDSEEFNIVRSYLCQTLPEAVITKLTRIQNKYLMDHYITTIQKRQELNQLKNNVNFDRKALFHGTGATTPSQIYMNSDTGFDINFSKLNTFYGQGLYFAEEARYSHTGYKHTVGSNCYQLLLADVFVGNAYNSERDPKMKKAPHGYDSIKGVRDKFYIIYNNFHSYPLYLIDYSLQTQASMVNNNGGGLGVKSTFVQNKPF